MNNKERLKDADIVAMVEGSRMKKLVENELKSIERFGKTMRELQNTIIKTKEDKDDE